MFNRGTWDSSMSLTVAQVRDWGLGAIAMIAQRSCPPSGLV